jgi:hypothetical protein
VRQFSFLRFAAPAILLSALGACQEGRSLTGDAGQDGAGGATPDAVADAVADERVDAPADTGGADVMDARPDMTTDAGIETATCAGGQYRCGTMCVADSAPCSGACQAVLPKFCASPSVCIAQAGCCVNSECAASTPICSPTTHMCVKRTDGDTCTTQAECASGTCLICYPDADGDGFGNKWALPTGNFCGACPTGSANDHRDCHDNNVMVNPNADFHDATYATDPMDTSPDGWDWNCSDNDEREKTGTVLAPTGCAAGGTCANGCPANAQMNVAINQTCGQFTLGAACAAACPSPPAPGCMQVQVQTVQQRCR